MARQPARIASQSDAGRQDPFQYFKGFMAPVPLSGTILNMRNSFARSSYDFDLKFK